MLVVFPLLSHGMRRADLDRLLGFREDPELLLERLQEWDQRLPEDPSSSMTRVVRVFAAMLEGAIPIALKWDTIAGTLSKIENLPPWSGRDLSYRATGDSLRELRYFMWRPTGKDNRKPLRHLSLMQESSNRRLSKS